MNGTISTGYACLDEAICGWHPGHLVLVASRPSMGKSAFLLGAALSAVESDRRMAALFSFEMTFAALSDRVKLRGAPIQPLPMEAASESAALYIDSVANLSVSDIRQRCLSIRSSGVPRLILVDYLQLLLSPSGLAQNTRELKALGQELGATVLVATQLQRSETKHENSAPTLSALRAQCAVESEADLILFLYRHEDEESASIVIGKHRAGPIGSIKIRWNRRKAAFETIGLRV